jgi:hypothetical protein
MDWERSGTDNADLVEGLEVTILPVTAAVDLAWSAIRVELHIKVSELER